MNKCCNCGRIFESTKTCWDCKHFIRPDRLEYWGYGDCKLHNKNAHCDNTCDDFEDKEACSKNVHCNDTCVEFEDISNEVTLKVEIEDMQKAPVKIEIVKRESFVDETKHVFMVQVYDNEGELIDATGFKSENLAGRYAFEMEHYYKFLKED